jgi:hypothetical protein
MSEISGIGQKLAEQMAKNAQQEAGKPSEGDVAKFQEAMSQMNTQEAGNIEAAKLPGPADVQSISSDYATKGSQAIADSVNDFRAHLPNDLLPEASKGLDGLKHRIQDAQKELQAIASDTSLSANEASTKVENVGKGLTDYIQDSITEYRDMRGNLEQQLSNMKPGGDPVEMLKLQKSLGDVTTMTNMLTSLASNITGGIKTMLQQQ